MASFIEFPIFTGVAGELRPWISWLEEFFVRENFTALEKLNLAQSLLEGEAEAWFNSSRKRFIFQSWEHLMDLMIWRFGDFSDPVLFLLFDKNDRLLQKQRDDAKLRRMSRTTITPHESISSSATIQETIPVDKFFTQQVAEIAGEKKELKKAVDLSLEKIASQLKLPNTKVHVSDSENLRNIETRTENSVLDNLETVVKEAKIQKNIRMDVNNGDVERIQRVMSITKNVSAYQVFDKTSAHKERMKPKTKRQLSLSPKTWMFKFKNKNLQRQYSCSRAKCGYKWKEHNSRYGRRMRQTRLLCNLRVRQDPRGLEQLILDDLKSHMRHKWKSKHLRAVFDLQTSPSYALDVVNKTSKPWETHKTFPSTHVASVNSLSFAVGTTDNFELCVGHEKGIMRLKLLLQSGFVGDKLTELDFHISENHGLLVFPWNLMLLEIFLFVHLEEKVCLSGASNSWCGWMVFDRGKNNIISGDVIALVFLDLKKCFFQGAEKRDVQMMLLVKAQDAHVDSLIVRIKELWIANMVEINTGVSWAELKWIIWSVSSNIVEATKVNVNSETRHGVGIILILKRGPKLEGNCEMRGLLGIPMSCFGDNGSVLVMVLYFNLDGKKWYTKRELTTRDLKNCTLPFKFVGDTSLHAPPTGQPPMREKLEAHIAENSQVEMLASIDTNKGYRSTPVAISATSRPGSTIHDVFPVSQLKDMIGDHQQVHSTDPPELLALALWIPEVILEVKFDEIGRREFLMKWQDYDHSENSWMLSKDFVHLYPSFKLEDKLIFGEGSIDTTHQVYYRKKKKELAVGVATSSNSSEASD